ncbi:MAG: DUF2461 domain-containing protein [gamma proteobacterium symbiont of Taylorina sp.]|nr:DUF2461 domain-containing protein [gamma proteobacterium symbiont of Taylorina sp.]
MSVFKGFSQDVIHFLQKIKHNNNKLWFDQHYDFYQREILEVSRDLVEALGESLYDIAPGINVVPKVNGSIYRFSRDARFSKDKTPYKTHLSYLFWQGALKRTRCPGFYLAIRPQYIQIGVGINHFTPEYLTAWREQCARPEKEKKLRKIINQLAKSGVLFQGEQLKRMPRGFSETLLNQELIRYKGFKCYFQLPLPEDVYSENLVCYCLHYYQQLLPLFEWMVMILSQFSIQEADYSKALYIE